MLAFNFSKIHFNSILPSIPGSSKLSSFLKFSYRSSPCISSLFPKRYIPCLSLCYWFDHPNNIFWVVYSAKLSLCSHLHSPVTTSLLGPNILLRTLFSKNLSLLFSLIVSDQVLTPIQNNRLIYSSVYFKVYIFC
jgi:hypothetical protein